MPHYSLELRDGVGPGFLAPFIPMPGFVQASEDGSAPSPNWLTFLRGIHIFNLMVELQPRQLNTIFHALGDATRRQMLRELIQGERTVGQLAEPFDISLAAASKHIKALENAGLIRRDVRGRTHLCRLDPGPLARAHEWLGFYERFWTDRLSLLDSLFQEEVARKPQPHKEDQP